MVPRWWAGRAAALSCVCAVAAAAAMGAGTDPAETRCEEPEG